jgi:hypothetical protein
MAGSPKKREKREAAEREKNLAAGKAQVAAEQQTGAITGDEQGDSESGLSAESSPHTAPAASSLPAVTPIQGEVLPPEGAQEPTRTALKRAMRARAQEHAEAAIAVLVACLTSTDLKERRAAANDLLAWGFGKPATEIEAGEGAAMIIVKKFFGDNDV